MCFRMMYVCVCGDIYDACLRVELDYTYNWNLDVHITGEDLTSSLYGGQKVPKLTTKHD